MPLTDTNLISGLPMMRTRPTLCYPALAIATGMVAAATWLSAQTPSASAGNDAAQLVEQGRKLNDEGKQPAALGLYERALKADPGYFDAHLAAAVALDLEGSYDAAREHLRRALASPQPDSLKVRALRTLAVSYAFTRNAAAAAKYEHEVIDPALARQDFVGAADVDNELARIYLESGDIDNAYKTYEAGHTTALRKTTLTPAERDLWDFRWEHAEARIAARRGQRDVAMQHVAAAKAILDRGTNPDQARFFPYLTGYVALYLHDYKAAIADLQKADQHDPFILCLTAEAYETLGDKSNATELYRKVLTINSHNPPNAFARPLAKDKVSA
jgi:tetratricopeptide (TPR) repeat protein